MDQYTYRVTWSPEDQCHVALCEELPSLSWLAATPEEAFVGIRRLVAECIQEMIEGGEVPPSPLTRTRTTEQMSVAVSPNVHRRLALQAAEEGRSLDDLVSDLLSDKR
jgi:predicted HicB family RNase H-like nuclease